MMECSLDSTVGPRPAATDRERRARGQTAPRHRSVGSRIAPSTAVVTCPRTDGAVLIDAGSGRRITLDAFGSRLWTELGDHPSLAELLARLHDDGTPAERMAEDVCRVLARWRAAGMISWR
jgi:hypothetical protein